MPLRIRAKPNWAAGPVVLQRLPAGAISAKDAAGMNAVDNELLERSGYLGYEGDVYRAGIVVRQDEKEKSVEAPGVLPEEAKEVWRSAFNSAFGGTYKAKSGEQREARAASVAWSAVKESYKKTSSGEWVEKTFEESGIDIGEIPLPVSLYESPVSAALTYCYAFTPRYMTTKDIANATLHAWSKLKEKYDQSEDGVWKPKNGTVIERVSEETHEAEMAEPVIHRSMASSGVPFEILEEDKPIVLDRVKPEEIEPMIQRHGNSMASRPADFPMNEWALRPWQARTVVVVLRMKQLSRAYVEAVERIKSQGWDTEASPNGSGEVVFKGWVNVGRPDREYVRAILVSKESEGFTADDWRLQIVKTTGAHVAPGMKRFRGPILK